MCEDSKHIDISNSGKANTQEIFAETKGLNTNTFDNVWKKKKKTNIVKIQITLRKVCTPSFYDAEEHMHL